jgi:hypothetical protein
MSGTGSGGLGEISRILLGARGRLGGERGHDDVAAPSGEAVRGALAVIHLMTVADSTGQRKKLGELLRWFHESESFARPVVQAVGDLFEIGR